MELLIGSVDHGRGLSEKADLVGRLDATRLHEHLLPVDDVEALLLKGEQHGKLDDVDAQGLVRKPELLQLPLDLLGQVAREVRVWREGATQGRDAGTCATLETRPLRTLVRSAGVGIGLRRGDVEPGVVQRVVLGR
ncbi:hypothetical protein JCM18899A_48590 [Nocardioides sp. AN3]